VAAALAAFDQAVHWAPHYAHTLWQRGNLKLRMGQYGEAFADLRAAAESRKNLLPSVIDLAWGLSRGDVNTVKQLIQINNDQDRLAFARYLAQKGKGDECLEQLRLLAVPVSDENRREVVQQLISAKAFRSAFELWRTDETLTPPVIVNGGFEKPFNPRVVDEGFGWFVVGKSEAKIVRDQSKKLSGETSLLLGFNGDWKAPAETIRQRIVVAPERRYRISFAVKTKDLVSGAPPSIAVTDAVTQQRLGQSQTFPTPSSDWQTMSFEFSTTSATQSVVLEFTRVESAGTPIFGELWLDDFLIEDVTPVNPQR
jgi:tetratricopeptide (TPR) repeat protein